MTTPVSDCCGARLAMWMDDGGHYEHYCDECGEEMCSACAGSWDVDGGYGDGGGHETRVFAKCKDCAPKGGK